MRRPVKIIFDVCAGFLRDRSAATSIEYTLIASIISIGILVGAGTLGTSLKDLYTSLAEDVTEAADR
ncbi:Flp family type IVb pilin [Phyllobacterium bourgognense]|uniref:Pilus assembly protein Flp/PilA n=1 Tax=Phyllobacterium bourgognense TaxID=314236 RepID=A0A368Z7I5_9HYPH|nr:Flp family type IVb pilin [Phyllobacterium bourgognense]RCW87456.1 pilus assembly protein Flp/PilA [Phyllobacterium bourgognense]